MIILLNIIFGLGLFLFAMSLLEVGIGSLGHNFFNRWISRSTNSALGSALSGLGITAIVQSSSMVSLLVLAFASAGVIPLYNAIGVLLGANLGTTATGWVVATLGFKLELAVIAIPMMGVGGFLQLSGRFQSIGKIIFSLGLLIFGLGIMKEAVVGLPSHIDIGALQGHSLWFYYIVGIILATVIQSSSGVMMITLAALHSHLLGLPEAAALIIGADLGTTSTTMLASIGRSSIKRQLALAHFLFNLCTNFVAMLILLPLLPAMLALVSISDPLYSLVAFHSLLNFTGLAVFLPLLRPWSSWIGRQFISEVPSGRPLLDMPAIVPEAALRAVQSAVNEMLVSVISINLHNIKLKPEQLTLSTKIKQYLSSNFQTHYSFEQRYQLLKQQESDLVAFCLLMQEQELTQSQTDTLLSAIESARALVYSCKSLKDIREDLISIRHSDSSSQADLYEEYLNFHKMFYAKFLELALGTLDTNYLAEQKTELRKVIDELYDSANKKVHNLLQAQEISGIQLSTLLNSNREIHHSARNLLESMQVK